MCAHLAISAASEATGAMSGVCAVAVGALAGLIGLKVSFAAPPRAPKKRQPRNGVTERERPRCFCEPLGAEPMSIRSRLPRASVAKGPPGISFHSSEAADHLNCTRVSTGALVWNRAQKSAFDRAGSRGSRGGYPLAALGSEDWCNPSHGGVFSDGRPSVHGVATSPTAPASSRVSRE